MLEQNGCDSFETIAIQCSFPSLGASERVELFYN